MQLKSGVSEDPVTSFKDVSMHTIVLATQKGGSGKSTLAIGLALAAQQTGQIVRLIETDKQGTLSNWQSRRGLAEPIVEQVYHAHAIEQRLHALERGGVTLTVIDTASGTTAATTTAIRYCDLCLIPTRPSVADIEAMAATLRVARAWRKPFAFVLNQTPIRVGHRISDATSALDQRAPRDLAEVLAQPLIAMRNDHQDALAKGLAVSEYAPTGKSAAEIRELWRWVDDRLNDRPLATDEVASELSEQPLSIMFVETPEQVSAATRNRRPAAWADAALSWDAGL